MMLVRRPGAKLVGTAILRDHHVVERLYADIEGAPESAVYGVLWRITDDERHRLGRCEGVAKVIYTRNAFRVQSGWGSTGPSRT